MIMNENSESFAECDLKTEYTLKKSQREYEGLPYSQTFGISASFTDCHGKKNEKTISDISLQKETVEGLIKILTENNVSFYHFEAVIEDALFENTFI